MLAGGLLSGCGKKAAPQGQRGPSGPPKTVEVAFATPQPMQRVIPATGSLLAQERSILSAKVSGRLQQLNVDIGTRVSKGDVLAQIEPRDYELGLQQAAAALAQARTTVGLPAQGTNDTMKVEEVSAVKSARALLEEATKNRDRIQTLSASGIAAKSELDAVEAAHAVAATGYEVAVEEAQARIATIAERRAELRLAEKRLSDASLRAPFDGIVQSRPANVGEFVAAGTPTVELVKSHPLRLRLQVPERHAALVRMAQPVTFHIEGDTNVHSAQIERMSPALDEDSRMLYVEADVPSQGALRPGLFVRAQIVVAQGEPTLSVPENAVVTFAGLEKVVTVQTNRALEAVIITGRRANGFVEVLEGLKKDQPVILNPGGLRTGAPVTVKSAETSQARAEPSGS